MTKGELLKIEERVDEINDIIDLCSDYDQDVLIALENELTIFCEVLERSIYEQKKVLKLAD